MRLASWMPFEQARELLQDLVGIQESLATVQRATLQTGEAALAVCEGEVERLKQEVPQAPDGADKQLLSADGAMVHLVGGEWAEVKTLVMGEVTRNKRGEVCTQQISSFSRLAEAERFTEAALVETHRRGLERAAAVCAVQDGAEWRPRLVDSHRADAVRILDASPCRRIRQCDRASRAGSGGQTAHDVVDRPAPSAQTPGTRPRAQASGLVGRRLTQPTHPRETGLFAEARNAHAVPHPIWAAGWPIGSGSVESANKGVVEARLKGAGMRLPSAERQSHAGAPQCGLQSAVAPDVDDSGGPSTSASHASAASRQSAAVGPGLLVPRLLGSTGGPAVPPTGPRCHRTFGSYPRGATNSSFWLPLFLAHTFSQTPSFHLYGSRRGVCKKMNRTRCDTCSE